jgi:hypothetical protein
MKVKSVRISVVCGEIEDQFGVAIWGVVHHVHAIYCILKCNLNILYELGMKMVRENPIPTGIVYNIN